MRRVSSDQHPALMHIDDQTGATAHLRTARVRWAVASNFAAFIAMANCAAAFELQVAEAQFADQEYRFDMTAVLDAPVGEVERILRDYENYTTLDTRILEARVLDRPDSDSATLATTLRACFGPVCRTVKRVEQVEESPHALVALTDASRSDMKFGETRVELSTLENDRTLVIYRTRLKPAFWIPALVARRMMLKTLEDATIELFQNVEKQAAGVDATGSADPGFDKSGSQLPPMR